MKGLTFELPTEVQDKKISVIEVGPFAESGTAREINKFLGTQIEDLTRINTYLLVHPTEVQGIEKLLTGKPFVDPITHTATLNSALISKLGIPFDYVLQSMLNPGTSDAEGDTALRQALLSLGYKTQEGDVGFLSAQHFLKGNLTTKQLSDVSDFLANLDLNRKIIVPFGEYATGKKVTAPVVTLNPKTNVETFDITHMTDDELVKLSSTRRLAATLGEMQQFRDTYKDEKFIEKRKQYGLDNKATDVELETWFGLRSEHCFHKEFNAKITLEDKLNDPVFKKAFEKGWLTKNDNGEYVIEKGMFKTFVEEPAKIISAKLDKRGNNWIASMFDDNSGVVYYNKDYMFCIKFETHNSPSNKEPVQGAKTGIDGVNRDIFGTMLGTFDAISNHFYYCTGNPAYQGWLPKGVKHPYMILKGITQGVREGGNESQIPTLGGGLITDPRYIAKCLVYCGTVGWSPVRSQTGIDYTKKHASVGDIIFVAGQPVGIDGVHGSTESSLTASANISLGHVQADFSLIQAKAKGYILKAARDGLFTDIGDFGAMGLGSASHEAARATGGLEMDLAKHPVKYKGIQPWQVNCSETQDRMLLIAKPESQEELLRRAEMHEVQVTPLGQLTDSGYVHLKYDGKTVALIDMEKLFNKEPRKQMHATWEAKPEQKQEQAKKQYTLEETLCSVISQPDIASKEWFFRQKDSSVKGATIQGPLIGLKQEVEADATIQKPLDTEGKDWGAIAYAMGITPKLSDIDAYNSAQKSFTDMVGKIIAVGGALPDMTKPKWDAWAVCGNYCQPNSESRTTLTKQSGEHNLSSLVREGIAIREGEEELDIPLISGKDSMKCSCEYKVANDFKLEDLPPDLRRNVTLVEKQGKEGTEKWIEIHDPDSYLASCAVKIDDYRKCVSSAFKEEGDLIYVVGTTKNHLGASQLNSALGYKENGAPLEGGNAPRIDYEEFRTTAGAIHSAIDQELIASCSYIHEGGIQVALSKAAMAGEKGANIDIRQIFCEQGWTKPKDDEVLYSQTPGRFMMTIAEKDREIFEKTMSGTICSLIGKVTQKELQETRIEGTTETINLENVKEHYKKPLSFSSQEKVN